MDTPFFIGCSSQNAYCSHFGIEINGQKFVLTFCIDITDLVSFNYNYNYNHDRY